MPARACGTIDCATRDRKRPAKRWRAFATTSISNEGTQTVEGWVGRPLLVVQPNFQQTQLFLGSIVSQSPWPQPQDGTCHLRGALNTSILCPLVLPRTQCHQQLRHLSEACQRQSGHTSECQLPTEFRERAEGLMSELPHWHGRRHACQPVWYCKRLKHLLPCRLWPMYVLVQALSCGVSQSVDTLLCGGP